MVKEFTLYTGQIVKRLGDGSFRLYDSESDEVGMEIKDIFDLIKTYDNIVKSVKNETYLV